jgi:hypothetical protein
VKTSKKMIFARGKGADSHEVVVYPIAVEEDIYLESDDEGDYWERVNKHNDTSVPMCYRSFRIMTGLTITPGTYIIGTLRVGNDAWTKGDDEK